MKKIGQGSGEGTKRTSEAVNMKWKGCPPQDEEQQQDYDNLIKLLKNNGYEVVEGIDEVRKKIEELANG